MQPTDKHLSVGFFIFWRRRFCSSILDLILSISSWHLFWIRQSITSNWFTTAERFVLESYRFTWHGEKHHATAQTISLCCNLRLITRVILQECDAHFQQVVCILLLICSKAVCNSRFSCAQFSDKKKTRVRLILCVLCQQTGSLFSRLFWSSIRTRTQLFTLIMSRIEWQNLVLLAVQIQEKSDIRRLSVQQASATEFLQKLCTCFERSERLQWLPFRQEAWWMLSYCVQKIKTRIISVDMWSMRCTCSDTFCHTVCQWIYIILFRSDFHFFMSNYSLREVFTASALFQR